MHRTRYLAGLLTLALTVVGVAFLIGVLGGGEAEPGLSLRIEFRDARGLRGGADVRYRGVTVGTVRAVRISEDGGKAIAELLLDQAGAAQACVDSSFWVVSPRFSGLATGATGLDTLVRDAYVAFFTPEERGSPLQSGSLVVGRERPPAALDPETLEPVAHGDLLMTLLVPENHGLRAGSTVVFRGATTGDVREVELAPDGAWVEVQLRIHGRHRRTITDKTTFWIARPYVSGALFSGFTVADVSALLSPYVAYHTPTGTGTPVEDDYRAVAAAMRPDVRIDEVPPAALVRRDAPPPPPADPLVVVRIVYAAVEDDWFSRNDQIRRSGTGVLYLDGAGRPLVLTARSLVDAAFTERDLFGTAADVTQEQIKVMLPGGTVLRAGRIWVDAQGGDLAVLSLEGARPDLRVTPGSMFDFAAEPPTGPTAGLVLRCAGEDGRPEAARDLAGPNDLPAVDGCWGGAVVTASAVRGLLGRTAGTDPAPRLHLLRDVPEDLRPRR